MMTPNLLGELYHCQKSLPLPTYNTYQSLSSVSTTASDNNPSPFSLLSPWGGHDMDRKQEKLKTFLVLTGSPEISVISYFIGTMEYASRTLVKLECCL